MALKAIVWVLEHSESTLGDRLVLLGLAENASDDGSEAYPSVATLARKTRLSERQVQRCLRNLEAAGEIVTVGTSQYGTNVYRLVMGGDNLSGVTSEAEILHDLSPEPRTKPNPSESGRALEVLEQQNPLSARTQDPAAGTWKVDRKPVSAAELTLARDVLYDWNRVTGQNLTSRDWLSMIVMRHREHPELGIPDHHRILVDALQKPWWDGPPSPNVVYGNGAQFERCLTAAQNPAPPKPAPKRYGRGVTVQDVLEGRL